MDLHKNGLLRMQRIHGEVPAGLQRQLSADRGTRPHHVVASGSVSSDVEEYEPMSSPRPEEDDYIVMKSACKSRPIEYEDMQSYTVGRDKIEQYTAMTSPTRRCVHMHACVCYVCMYVVQDKCVCICTHVHTYMQVYL